MKVPPGMETSKGCLNHGKFSSLHLNRGKFIGNPLGCMIQCMMYDALTSCNYNSSTSFLIRMKCRWVKI